MGKLLPITKHVNYVPWKVRADLFYGVDPNLDDNARMLYNFLLTVAKRRSDGTGYLPWPTMDDSIGEIIMSEWGKELPMYAIKNAFSQLRKNRYLRHTYQRDLGARVLELIEFIGEDARD